MTSSVADPEQPLQRRLLESYRPLPGRYDEAFSGPGALRSHAAEFYRHFASRERGDLEEHARQIQAQLVEFGLAYRTPGEEGYERPGELDPLPSILPAEEYRRLARGVAGRAKLLDALLSDLTGDQDLLRRRLLPAELVLNNPRFQRATSSRGRPDRLSLYAVDLVRDARGEWRAIADHTGILSGWGFALEHRMIISRLYARMFDASGVERLAAFFMSVRDAMRASAPGGRENPRIVYLTRGPDDRDYFEDAYLARYLGFTLAEAEDLAVRDSKLFLKTLGGLVPVHVVLRGLFDDDCDPVELKGGPRGAAGVAGLLEASREGATALLNPIGSGLLETPVFAAYLDRLNESLFGESLALPSLPTWWTGDEASRAIVAERFQELQFFPVYSGPYATPLASDQMPFPSWAPLRRRWEENPGAYVFRETPLRSTSPVWNGESLEPWSYQLRMFAVRNGDEFQVMPGALARLTPPPGTGGASAVRCQDVWALADGPVERVSLLLSPGAPVELRRSGAELPSRVAENLYWLGRTLERTENSARLLRALLYRLTGEADVADSVAVRALARTAAAIGLIETFYGVQAFEKSLPRLDGFVAIRALRSEDAASIATGVADCLKYAAHVRDRLSNDFWQILNRMERALHRATLEKNEFLTDEIAAINRLIFDFCAASGVMHESGTRTLGWRFLEIGRRMERAIYMATLIQQTLVARIGDQEGPALEATLEAGDSIMTYRSRYLGQLQVHAALDLLLLDETNPRSVAFQLEALQRQVAALPRAAGPHRAPDEKIALSLLESVRTVSFDDLLALEGDRREKLAGLLEGVKKSIAELSKVIVEIYLIHAGLPRQFSSIAADEA